MNIPVLLKKSIRVILGHTYSPAKVFLSYEYLRHNQRRLEHLASLGLDIGGASVLEVGAGIGDHTSFFLDRGCRVTSSDARKENLEILRDRYPNIQARYLNLDEPDNTMNDLFDIVYCYGLLYHLEKPANAIEYMARRCSRMLLLETAVSFGDSEDINNCGEIIADPSQSFTGIGCRPTRVWIYNKLKQYFDHVYMPITQPNHEQFPLDWTLPSGVTELSRSIFVASRITLTNNALVEGIPMHQKNH